MAIISTQQLPIILRVDSNPLKLHIQSQLGHPIVNVEITEVMYEQILRSTGDFIANYFPLNMKLAYFMTQPLQAEYPIPEDAYWIRNVVWDPVVSRLSDIFSSESFLFSFCTSSVLLTKSGPVKYSDYIKLKTKPYLVTPFGNRKSLIRLNNKECEMLEIKTKNDRIICTLNHPIKCDNNYIMAKECKVGQKLESNSGKLVKIKEINKIIEKQSISIKTNVGCYYISTDGKDFYLVH